MIGLQLPMLQAGAAAGATPGPMNWTDLVAAITGVTNNQMASVGEASVWRIEFSSISLTGESSAECTVLVNDESAGNIEITNAAAIDFSISDGDVVKFSAGGLGESGWSFDCVATVKYGAPSFGSTLDTFNINLGS